MMTMMTMISKLKSSSRAICVSRKFHAGAIIKNLNDKSDTKHLFKKKYEFIKKQNLEDAFKNKNSNNLKKSNYSHGDGLKKSDSDIDETLEMTQKFKGIALGLIVLGFTIGGIQIYLNWNWVQSKIYGDNFDAESFDEMYERVKDKKYKKIEKIDQFSTTISNPNDTSVPGIYICGNNSNHLTSDNSEIPYQPFFKRLDFFDNFIVKDLKLSDTSGALINDKGDLYQWGTGFGGDHTKPTIKGKKLVSLEFSNGVIYGLTNRGEILYIPENIKLQETINNKERGWLGSYNVHFFKLKTPKLVTSISAGLQHIVLLSKDGSVYTSATGYNTKIEKSYGQFGLPEFSQFDEPPKINEVHEVTLLNKYIENGQILKRTIKQIATGDVFTLCLDSLGSVWAFGKNTYGSVGKVINYDTEIVPYPSKIQLINNNFKKTEFPQCINIAAGGDTAFATFVSSNIYHLFEKSLKSNDLSFNFEDLSESQQDSLVHFAWGHGLKGELGLGYFVHGIYEPKKIKNLNNIKEFNEATQKLETTGIKSWSVGKNHIAVTLTNNDVYVWGDNEYGQLGNGKRIRLSMPSTVPSILEPNSAKKKNRYAKYNDRLQLLDIGNYHQVIVAGRDTTAIYYKKD